MAGLRRLTGLFLFLGALLLGAGAQETVPKAVGSEVTLEPKYTGNPSEITWKINGNKLVDLDLNSSQVEPTFYRLRDRATIDRTNGVLTIKNLTTGDSGDYRAEALVNKNYQYTEITLTVQACPDVPNITNTTTKENITLYCESSTPGVTYKWFNQTGSVGNEQSYSEPRPKHDVNLTCVVGNEVCKKRSSIIIRHIPPAQQTVLELKGSEVTLEPKYTGNPSEINWRINGERLVEMKVIPPDEPIFYYLQDRASIDRTNGRLTIRDLHIEDSGVYRAEALVNNNYQYIEITLTVQDYYHILNEMIITVLPVALIAVLVPPAFVFILLCHQNNYYHITKEMIITVLPVVFIMVLVPLVVVIILVCLRNNYYHILNETIIAVLIVFITVLVSLVFVIILVCLWNTPCMVTFFDKIYYVLTCCKGTDKPENEQNTPLITLDSESCGCISLNLSSKGPVKNVELFRDGVPSIDAFLGRRNGQPQIIKSLVLTLEWVKTEDYAAEAHLPNGELRVFTIKGVKGEDDAEKGHVVYKKVEEEDNIVFIKTWRDQVILIVPDTEAVTRLAWKKGDVPQFEWTISGVKLHTNKITLEPGSITIRNLVPGDSGTYEVDIQSADGSITKNTFQLKVVKRGNAENVMLKVVRKVDPPEDGDTESQPIGSITFHPIKMTNKTGITWKKEGSPVSYFGDRITLGQNGDLTINDATVEDKGTYTVHTEDQKQEFDLRL